MTKFDEYGLPEPTKYPQISKEIKMKINPIDKAYGFLAYANVINQHPNKLVSHLGVESNSIVPATSCVVNISNSYYEMMNTFPSTNLPD